MKLTNPTDAQLNEAFNRYVRGLKPDEVPDLRDFVHSADAVLPWLEKHAWIARQCKGGVHVTVDTAVCFESVPFAKAAVIALLRAHGVEVEFAP